MELILLLKQHKVVQVMKMKTFSIDDIQQSMVHRKWGEIGFGKFTLLDRNLVSGFQDKNGDDVLKAMDFNHEQISGSLRMSFGYMNTLDEVEQTVEVLKMVVAELRRVSPYKTKYNF